MKCNIGKTDRIARVIFGFALLGLGFYFKSYWGFIGIIPLTTAIVRWCPAYVPFNISTAEKEMGE